jgi:hypothetical protein
MSQKRYYMSKKMLKHKDLFIGLTRNNIVFLLGEPDFINENFNVINYYDSIALEYSTSSLEIINGKCGDPVIHSISFLIDKTNMKVLTVVEAIY